MPRGNNKNRHGILVTAGHSTRIEDLDPVLKDLSTWPEVSRIRIGQITNSNSSANRRGSGVSVKNRANQTFGNTHSVKRRKGGGGLSFKATRYARVGDKVTGILCVATKGSSMQHVVLCGPDLDALKKKLQENGLGGAF